MVAELGLSLSDGLIIAAIVAAAVKVIADQRGWTRSTALVRQENADLRERNATLEADVKRLDQADRQKAERIAVLEAKLVELETRDQKAVLEAIATHDLSMVRLGESLTKASLDHERNAQARSAEAGVRHDEAIRLWREIRDRIGTPPQ